jgi:hypothetical protein
MKLLNNLKLTDIRSNIINTKDVKIKIIQKILKPFVHIVQILSMIGLIFDKTL